MNQKINFLYENNPLIISKTDDVYEVLSTHKLSPTDLINLCGGVPLQNIREVKITVFSRNPDVLEIQVSTAYYELTRVIDFRLKIINNSYMYVEHSMEGIGTRLFCNQVKEAFKKGFRVIYTTAMGRDAGADWAGYYSWGRLGYQMTSDDQAEFSEWAAAFKRPEKSLWDLLRTEDGRALWLAYGFTWSGKFLLAADSDNMRQLRKYLLEKGLNYTV